MTQPFNSSSDKSTEGLSTTYALGNSPEVSSGIDTTATSEGIPHNGHKNIQEEREIGGLVFVSESAKPYHMHKQPHSYLNQNPMPNQRVVCDHCEQLSSTYLRHAHDLE